MLLLLRCYEAQCSILLRKRSKLRTPKETRFNTFMLYSFFTIYKKCWV